MAWGSKTRAEQALEQVNKKERGAREIVLQQKATIIGVRAQVVELRERLKAIEEEGKPAVANKVRSEALLQEKSSECDEVLSILNRTYGPASSPAK